MRITEIRVTQLFNLFDHVIPLNKQERVTILHGPNGFGKTTILRLVAAVLEGDFRALRSVPFEKLEFDFDSGETLVAERPLGSSGDASTRPGIVLRRGGEEFLLSRGPIVLTAGPREIESLFANYLPFLERIAPDMWLDRGLGDAVSTSDAIARYRQRLNVGASPAPQWLADICSSTPVAFLGTNRLEHRANPRVRATAAWRAPEPGGVHADSVVDRHARQIADLVFAAQAKYAELAQSLDRTFPRRLLSEKNGAHYSVGQIRDKLANLEKRSGQLMEAGLLDQATVSDWPADSHLDASKADVLSIYIDDANKKLAVFGDLYEKLRMLTTTLNGRFLYKTARIAPKQGLVFEDARGAPLPASCLSSGEQHLVAVLVHLLFNTKPNTLVLIDEPEISLHIVWQEHVVHDLLTISRLASTDFLVATHSPYIVHDRWDLTVELKEPLECRHTKPITPSPMLSE